MAFNAANYKLKGWPTIAISKILESVVRGMRITVYHYENCKKVEVQYGFCASAVGVSTEVFLSTVAACG